jgi:hypothetical protein
MFSGSGGLAPTQGYTLSQNGNNGAGGRAGDFTLFCPCFLFAQQDCSFFPFVCSNCLTTLCAGGAITPPDSVNFVDGFSAGSGKYNT